MLTASYQLTCDRCSAQIREWAALPDLPDPEHTANTRRRSVLDIKFDGNPYAYRDLCKACKKLVASLIDTMIAPNSMSRRPKWVDPEPPTTEPPTTESLRDCVDVRLPLRVLRVLEDAGVSRNFQLATMTEADLLSHRGIGQKAIDAVSRWLGSQGLSLGTPPEDLWDLLHDVTGLPGEAMSWLGDRCDPTRVYFG